MSKEIVIASACRTAIGRFLGTLAPLKASDLGGVAVAEAVKRAGIKPEETGPVIHPLPAYEFKPVEKYKIIKPLPEEEVGHVVVGGDDVVQNFLDLWNIVTVGDAKEQVHTPYPLTGYVFNNSLPDHYDWWRAVCNSTGKP